MYRLHWIWTLAHTHVKLDLIRTSGLQSLKHCISDLDLDGFVPVWNECLKGIRRPFCIRLGFGWVCASMAWLSEMNTWGFFHTYPFDETVLVGGCIFCVWIALRWILGFVFLHTECFPGKVSSHQAREKHQYDAQGTHFLHLRIRLLQKCWNITTTIKICKAKWDRMFPWTLKYRSVSEQVNPSQCVIGIKIMEHAESTHSTCWIIHWFDPFVHWCLPVMDSSVTIN